VKIKYNDKIHGYWLDGVRCKGISTAAKVPDDTWGLDQWRKRMVLVGLANKPALLKLAQAHHDDKDKLNEIAEEALLIAGASDAAAAGTATHRIIERHILGEEVIQSAESDLVIANFKKVMTSVGLTPLPQYVERVVAYPDERLCGRFDHLALRESDQRLAVCDVKTGASAIRYPHATAVQLALYAHAPAHAVLPSGRDGVAQLIDPPADIDPDEGYVINITETGADVYVVNLKLGWACAEQIIFPTYRWRGMPAAKLIRQVS
jgi:hypothetical protein